MSRLTAADLRRETLRRQFPTVEGSGPARLTQLFARLGPIQSQVPRAPFLTAATRAPGSTYAELVDLFETHTLLKASTLRGTVHVSVAEQFDDLDAVARGGRAALVGRVLPLAATTPAELVDGLEAFCRDSWRSREDVVDHARSWLASRGEEAAVQAIDRAPTTRNLLSGLSGLARRPPGTAWATRTDTLRRDVGALRPTRSRPSVADALVRLAPAHLRAYGPATLDDLTFFLGVGRRDVGAALRTLGERLVERPGPGGISYLDLAEPPVGGEPDPGLRLLPEFDGVLLGYAAKHRTRFLIPEQYPLIWNQANGLLAPLVLDDGRIVATWKTVTSRGRTDLDVTMLAPNGPLPVDRFSGPFAALAAALDLTVGDVRVRSST